MSTKTNPRRALSLTSPKRVFCRCGLPLLDGPSFRRWRCKRCEGRRHPCDAPRAACQH